jgi:hypothetical protein
LRAEPWPGRRGHDRQSIPILDLPLPKPVPDGAEWIEAQVFT